MREQIMNQLVGMLNANVGNKLTFELGTGIATTMNQFIGELEAKKQADGPVATVVANRTTPES